MFLSYAVDDEVIDKSRIVTVWFIVAEFTDSVHYPIVEERHIEVAQDLRGNVSDGHAFVGTLAKKAF